MPQSQTGGKLMENSENNSVMVSQRQKDKSPQTKEKQDKNGGVDF